MTNFIITFEYPWLLLLLVGAVILTFIPYFRVKKAYRNSRKRITSMILHFLVSVLAITVLAGMQMRYYIPNEENEIILLVDVSDTQECSQNERDQFVQSVINDSAKDGFNVGVVTFGFDQVYAVPLTNETENIFDTYLMAQKPDCTATNVADALKYTSTLFNHPKTGKIVLVTDGKQTDGDASNVMQDIVSKGITVDTVFVPSAYSGMDVQVTNIVMPEYYVQRGISCEIGATIYSNATARASVTLYDNGVKDAENATIEVDLIEGYQNVSFKHAFVENGLHELCVNVTLNDAIEVNNEFYFYHYLEVFNKILIIERANESQPLVNLLNENVDDYQITVVDAGSDNLPATVEELREYHQIILNNIAYSDLPEGYDSLIKDYVSIYGGGVLTTGGNDENGKANSYNRSDLYGTDYQEILPVEASTYTPPIGVMLIIDSSGSMGGNNDYGTSFFESAKAGALACLDVLYDRDYVGLMTLSSDHALVLDMTERTKESVIKEAIANLDADFGNTVFGSAIENAGLALRALKNVAKRHMIVISDGMTEEPNTYLPKIKEFYETDGITFSVIGINMEDAARTAMRTAVGVGHGRLHEASNTKDLVDSVREDLLVPKIEDSNEKEFYPAISNLTSKLVQDLDRGTGVDRNRLTVTLGGFYGTKVKKDADLVLIGEYDVPVYAQWKYGKGMVGSFMCDLQASNWSSKFMADENGQTFIRNVVNNLMPVENIQSNEMSVRLKESNYTNEISVFADLKKDESIRGQLIKVSETGRESVDMNSVTDLSQSPNSTFYITSALGQDNQFSRCSFVIKESGVYEIVLTKYDANGNAVGNTLTIHKSFAYSKEYDQTIVVDETKLKEELSNLANAGNGSLITDLEDNKAVFKGFVVSIEEVFDPRWLFMILAIVLFLLDVAVCKFKFKWLHEIIRDYKRRKNM